MKTAVNAAAYLHAEIAEHMAVALRTQESIGAEFPRLVQACAQALRAGHKLLLFGNGGAAAAAQHIATELVVRYNRDSGNRRPLAAIALTTDTSALTAVSNDLGYEEVFARQLAGLAQTGDIVIAISTSGRSKNVLKAAERARELGCRTIALTGASSDPLGSICDLTVAVPVNRTSRVQEAHITIGHLWCEMVDQIPEQ